MSEESNRRHAKAAQVPKYVHAAVKALGKLTKESEGETVDSTVARIRALPNKAEE